MSTFLPIENIFEGMFKPSSYTKPWLYPVLMPLMCVIFVCLIVYLWLIEPIQCRIEDMISQMRKKREERCKHMCRIDADEKLFCVKCGKAK